MFKAGDNLEYKYGTKENVKNSILDSHNNKKRRMRCRLLM